MHMDYLNLNIMLVRLFKCFLNLFVLEFKINIFCLKIWAPQGCGEVGGGQGRETWEHSPPSSHPIDIPSPQHKGSKQSKVDPKQ